MKSSESGVRSKKKGLGERGVALMIVLLVTALLIALVFEFAYGTRISMRSAVNFRDSQRAYYLARAGVNFAGTLLAYNLKSNLLQDNLEQRDPYLLPPLPVSDAQINLTWEDESGKINISNVTRGSTGYDRLAALFELEGISRDKIDQISQWMIDQKRSFYLVTELRQFLSDEEFGKVQPFVTTAPVTQIDVNTAPAQVLQSIGLSSGQAAMLVERRNREPFKTPQEFADLLGPQNTMATGQLATTSNMFKVNSYATVGGYTQQVTVIISRTTAGFSALYWRFI